VDENDTDVRVELEKLRAMVKKSGNAASALDRLSRRLDEQQDIDAQVQANATLSVGVTAKMEQLRTDVNKIDVAAMEGRIADLEGKRLAATKTAEETNEELKKLEKRMDELNQPAIDEKRLNTLVNGMVTERMGDMNYTKTAIEKITAEASTKLTAAMDEMKEKNTANFDAAVQELKQHVTEATESLGVLKEGVQAEINAEVEKLKHVEAQMVDTVDIYNKARALQGLGDGSMHIKAARKEQENEKAAASRDKSPYRARPFNIDDTPQPTLPAKPGAVKPASHSLAAGTGSKGTKVQFHSNFDESPYVFSDPPTWPT
jgi:hypothetical protein